MRKRGENGIVLLIAVFFLMFSVIVIDYFDLSTTKKHTEAAEQRVELTVYAPLTYGTIYDRNMRPL
ncbi:MAG: hypothetical protein GXY08_06950, partial [Ruminococcus sp.]|nr:hypothetical protein [Ruminococcus sp.]